MKIFKKIKTKKYKGKTKKYKGKTKKYKGGIGETETETISRSQTMFTSPTQGTVPVRFPGKGNMLEDDPLFTFLNNHTHSLESIVLTNFKNIFIDAIYVKVKDASTDYTETQRIGNKLVLSDASSMLLCSFHINRNVMIDDTLTYVPELHYDKTKSYIVECKELSSSGGKKYGGGEYDVLVYKYQDPVVRMVCEYMMLLCKMFYDDPPEDAPTIDSIYDYLQEYKALQASIASKNGISLMEQKYKYDYEYVKNNFWKFVRDVFMRVTRVLNPRKNTEPMRLSKEKIGYQEGTYCVFGLGKTNCCEESLKTYIDGNPRFQNIFTTKVYNDMKKTHEYQKYENMEPRFQELFDKPEIFLTDKTNISLMKFIAIYQEVINMIIIQSGRAEGKSGGPFLPYPPISVLEVFDQINVADVSTYVWIIRSERFHLSKSPCVHLGLQLDDITDKLTSFFCLPSSYETTVILHSIGHCLDRLYCGQSFNESSRNYNQQNEIILTQILDCFDIFLNHMKKQTADYRDENFQKLNIQNLTTELLYFISIQDTDSLISELGRQRKKLTDIYKDPSKQITDLYNVHFSFHKNKRDDTWVTKAECWHIKQKYGCSRIIKPDVLGTVRPIISTEAEEAQEDEEAEAEEKEE